MNENDYDEDGNNIVPCPVCLDVYCPGNQFNRNGDKVGDGKCPKEDEFARDMIIDREQWSIIWKYIAVTKLLKDGVSAKATANIVETLAKLFKHEATRIQQETERLVVEEIIHSAKLCKECKKPIHMHPHDFYDNELDCNCTTPDHD